MSPHSGERIGIIEDDLVVGGTLAHRLELEGYTPLWWRTGQRRSKGYARSGRISSSAISFSRT